MISSSVVLRPASSTLSLGFEIGSTFVSILRSALACSARSAADGSTGALGRAWSAGAGATHSNVYGLLSGSPQTGSEGVGEASHIDRWRAYVFDPGAHADVDALSKTADAALDFIVQFGPSSLSLLNFKPEEVQGEHLATLLRVTSTWREEIQGWDEALLVCEKALELSSVDPQDALFGMI